MKDGFGSNCLVAPCPQPYKVVWQDNSNNEAGFRVQISRFGTQNVPANATSLDFLLDYLDTCATVSAYNAAGESARITGCVQ